MGEICRMCGKPRNEHHGAAEACFGPMDERGGFYAPAVDALREDNEKLREALGEMVQAFDPYGIAGDTYNNHHGALAHARALLASANPKRECKYDVGANGKERDAAINGAIDSLESLFGESFHGYRLEVWRVLGRVFDSALSEAKGESGEETDIDEDALRTEAEKAFDQYRGMPRSLEDICPKYGQGDTALMARGFIDGYTIASRALLARKPAEERKQ